MAAVATTLFVIADRVNIRVLAELIEEILDSLYYDMRRRSLRLGGTHGVKIV